MEWEELQGIVAKGESETVEFKKSTGQLSRAGETLCALLNGKGGRVFFGVTPEGQIVGQRISDSTQQDLATMLSRFEPHAPIDISRIPLPNGLEVLVLEATPATGKAPYVFDARPYQRVGSTTSTMPHPLFEERVLERSHRHSPWEEAPAIGVQVNHLDEQEILRTVRLATQEGRLPETTGQNIEEILERLNLRKNGQILNAAVVLFGTDLLRWCPQCHLRLARFTGTDKTTFLNNRQVRGNAFALLNEAMEFLFHELPISGRFVPGKLERIDELLFPPDALREALVNGLCHRDYSIPGGALNVAVFTDRVEIASTGKLPFGLRPDDLKRMHYSQPRNELITDVFYRRGLIEQWGRGTQKIIELCKRAGHPEPEFQEVANSFVVIFRPASGKINTPLLPETTDQATDQATDQVTEEVGRLLMASSKPLSRRELLQILGLRHGPHFRAAYLAPAMAAGLIEMTIPDNPNSPLQRYRLTEKGRAWVAQHRPN
jgi:ATP-dependent DNA helicase RecG